MIPFPRRLRTPAEAASIGLSGSDVPALDPTSSCVAFERTFAEELSKTLDIPAPPPPPAPIQPSYHPPPPRSAAPRALARTIIIPRARSSRRSPGTWLVAVVVGALVGLIVMDGAVSGRFGRAVDVLAAIVDPSSPLWH
jgi:hypothetical protein